MHVDDETPVLAVHLAAVLRRLVLRDLPLVGERLWTAADVAAYLLILGDRDAVAWVLRRSRLTCAPCPVGSSAGTPSTPSGKV